MSCHRQGDHRIRGWHNFVAADNSPSKSNSELTRQLENIQAQLTTNRGDIDSLLDASSRASERADALDARVEEDSSRLRDVEARSALDHELIVELRTEGLLKDVEVEQMRAALGTSRRIGAAIGIVMAARRVTEDGAFAILRQASQDTNRKLRAPADDIVATGDVSALSAVRQP